eukprot:1158176-Pelagomonas_calceolata.AAC.2
MLHDHSSDAAKAGSAEAAAVAVAWGSVEAAAAAWGGLAVVQGGGKITILKEVRDCVQGGGKITILKEDRVLMPQLPARGLHALLQNIAIFSALLRVFLSFLILQAKVSFVAAMQTEQSHTWFCWLLRLFLGLNGYIQSSQSSFVFLSLTPRQLRQYQLSSCNGDFLAAFCALWHAIGEPCWPQFYAGKSALGTNST